MATALFFYLLSLCCWIGAIVFFSFFVAPVIFTRLGIADAGNLVATLFPRYYMLGYGAGVVGVALGLYLMVARGPWTAWAVAVIVIAGALALTVYAGVIVRPRVDALRHVPEQVNPEPAQKAEFDRLHRLSVMLNGGVLILDLIAVAATAAALAART